jgi:hypothetical protein
MGAVLAAADPTGAREPEAALPSGDEVVARVNARDDGHQVSRTLVMELEDKRGNLRTRETRSFRKDFGEERRSLLFYESPKNVKDTAFLTFDYAEPGRDDDQWLYLPALRKTRRISGADRGGAFLGTDFSYEDIKKETRIGVEDYAHKSLRREPVEGRPCIVVEHVPVSAEVARELGYGRVLTWVDEVIWIVRRAEYWDEKGEPLKTVLVTDIRPVDGIWTAHRLEARNQQTGHTTRFRFAEIDYATPVPDDRFTERALQRGL